MSAPRSASPPCLSSYSVLQLGGSVAARILFPGRFNIPVDGTAGYVRSEARAAGATVGAGQSRRPSAALPWRDYPDNVLTAVDDLLGPADDDANRLLLGARNSLNEYGYQVRMDGHWWRRIGDQPVPGDWPVLACSPQGLDLLPFEQAEATASDLVTGIPLVSSSSPRPREFFLANCSDPAHIFESHPGGLLGPGRGSSESLRLKQNRAVWLDLSEAWQGAKDTGLMDAAMADRVQCVAARHRARPSRHLLHSLIAKRADGNLLLIAITGSLDGIARHLSERWNAEAAILLDNGGSVGWWLRTTGSEQAKLLIAGPNYRPRGTAFLDLRLNGFINPCEHPALGFGDTGSAEGQPARHGPVKTGSTPP